MGPSRHPGRARSTFIGATALILYASSGLTPVAAAADTWQIQSSPNPGGYSNLLLGASALSEHDIWAVGNLSFGAGNQPLAEHWDGVGWTSSTTPPLPGGGSFSGVAALSRCNVWAVGLLYYNAVESTLAEHWDCNRWSLVPTPPVTAMVSALNGIAAGPGGDTWAVGFYQDTHSVAHPLVEHLVHQSWQIVASPSLGAGASLASVAVASDGSVWAVGSYTDAASGVSRTLIERFHQGHWDVTPSPNHGPGINRLTGVAAAVTPSPTGPPAVQVAAVGSWYTPDRVTQGPLIATWDGFRWREVPSRLLPSAPGSSAPLYGVAMTPNGDAVAVGLVSNAGTSARTLIAVIHDGQVGHVPSPDRPPYDNELFGVSTARDGTAVAIGFNASTGGAQNTLIETAG